MGGLTEMRGKDVKEGGKDGKRDEEEGKIDSVCLVLAYFKNTVGTKSNKHCGESRTR